MSQAGSDFFAIRRELMKLPVMPDHVFHPDSQEMFSIKCWTDLSIPLH